MLQKEVKVLRISFVMMGIKDHSTGGYAFNFHMAQGLAAAGHQVDVIHYKTIPEQIRGSRYRGSLHVLKRVLKNKPDLLIVSKSYSFMALLRMVLPFSGIPVLYMVHHLEWHDREDAGSVFRKAMVRWFLRCASGIWVNSGSTASDVELLGLPVELMTIVPPGMNRFPVSSFKERKKPVRIITAGTVCPRKDQLTLVKSCGMIKDLEFSLEILGDESADPQYAALVRNEVESLGLAERTVFHGHLSRDQLERLYGECHIFANLSRWEGYGMAVAEALWAGLPVIAADAGAVPELISHAVEGYLVKPGDAEDCARRLRELVSDGTLRETMSSNARRKAGDLFTWEDSRREFIKLAERTCSRPDK